MGDFPPERCDDMRWEEIRKRMPNEWLLVEVTRAHSENDRRFVEDLAVLNAFPDSRDAMRAYSEMHLEYPQREMYVLHTSREKLDIKEVWWLGLRPGQ